MKRAIAVLACAAVLALAGCETLKTISKSEDARDVITVATLYAIEQSSDRPAKAVAIIAAAEELKVVIDFRAVTLDDLVAEARARIARSDSELSEKAGLLFLLNRAERLMRDRIHAGELDPDAKATVNELLDWVIQAARAYAG